MSALYSEPTETAMGSLLATVAKQLRVDGPHCRLSPLVFMTDPNRLKGRTENTAEIIRRLPQGCAVIYRHFGNPDQAQLLRDITREQDRQLLIGNDPKLAETIGADGVHFSRDAALSGPITWRAKHPDWIITMAGLKAGAYLAPLDSLDALFMSSIFPSRSPSAGEPIGVENLKRRAAVLPVPVFALGGINAATAPQLIGSGIAGLAAIGGLIMDVEKEATDAGHRFIIKTADGEAKLTLAKVKSKNGNTVFNANHTYTPDGLRGQGVAGKLYAAMVTDAKTEGYKIIPGCSYVEVKFKRHPKDAAAVGV